MGSGPSLSEVGLRIYLRIRWVRFRRALGKIPTEPAAIFALLFLLVASVVFLLGVLYRPGNTGRWGLYDDPSIWRDLLIGAHGMLFDILVLGILFSVIYKVGERRLQNLHYQDEIRDFANWGTEEAVRRITGSVRRLNQNGITTIDLRDAVLPEADLSPYRFGEKERRVPVDLQGASLHRADLRRANLRRADLREANFFHAKLDGTVLEGADLRGALNLSVAQLMKTASLKDAQLDEDKAEAMKKKNGPLAEKLLSG